MPTNVPWLRAREHRTENTENRTQAHTHQHTAQRTPPHSAHTAPHTAPHTAQRTGQAPPPTWWSTTLQHALQTRCWLPASRSAVDGDGLNFEPIDRTTTSHVIFCAEQLAHITPPHRRQWWRRLRKLKLPLQMMHMPEAPSGIHAPAPRRSSILCHSVSRGSGGPPSPPTPPPTPPTPDAAAASRWDME